MRLISEKGFEDEEYRADLTSYFFARCFVKHLLLNSCVVQNNGYECIVRQIIVQL